MGVTLQADGVIVLAERYYRRAKAFGPPVYVVLSNDSPWSAYRQIGICLENGIRHFIAVTQAALNALENVPAVYNITYLKGVQNADTFRGLDSDTDM